MTQGTERERKRKNPAKDGPKPRQAFKNPRKSDSEKELVLTGDDDTDFPRGGASLLTKEERAEARAEAEAEFEREERGGNGKKKGKKERKNPQRETDDLGFLFSEGTTGKLPRFANRITLRNIKPKMKIWGIVVEVNSKDVVISLPGGLKGFVREEEISDISIHNNKDSETGIFGRVAHIGQLVPCIVVGVDEDNKKDKKGSKRVYVSLRLSLIHKGLSLDSIQDGMVMACQVKSVEDHGYILHFGVSDFSGFMPKITENEKIHKGQLLQCVVKNIDKTRSIVHLSADKDLISKSFTKDVKGLSIDHLTPGMLVNARVTSVLENGLMMSFLTYFTGTVDYYHLPNNLLAGEWKDEYSQHKKVVARILFIDPSTRAVGLTMNKDLVHNKLPSINVKIGDIYDEARVLRVDKGLGLLVEIPSSPEPSPAYISMRDVTDKEDLKIEKKFREGNFVRVRILGLRHLEGLAIATSKESALNEGSVFTFGDVKPGMIVRAKVVILDLSFGAIVQFSSGVKALCPLPHMSELQDLSKPPKKFQVGAELVFRVLGCKSKRITVTHKKSLVKSKLDIVSSYADAMEGVVTHGWISKIEKHGCFVKFYNGVQGFAYRSELGLQPGIEAETVYHVGQVVKCRIVSSKAATKRIYISFVISSKRSDEIANVGTIVCGVVEHLSPSAVVVKLSENSKGTIYTEHLADYHVQASALKNVLKPGYKFNQLLVIDTEGNNLILSAKPSLIKFASEIPSEASEIRSGSVVHGYISNIIEAGCFVRLLGNLTGFALKHKATDEQIEELTDAFCIGQSVRAHILNVNSESGRIKLSLQQSLCASSDVSLIQGYFLSEEKIAALQNSDQDWVKNFSIGSLVDAKIDSKNEFGYVVSFKNQTNVVGFIANHQMGDMNLELESNVKAVVLDISRSDGLIDLSLKTELVNLASNDKKKMRPNYSNLFSWKVDLMDYKNLEGKRRRSSASDLELHMEVNAIVEIVKENYLVLSIPEYNYSVGYACITDYNLQKLPHKSFSPGQSVTGVIGALPSSDSSERLLLLVKTLSEKSKSSSAKRAKMKSNYKVGSLVQGEIIEIKPLELIMKLSVGLHSRVHITEVFDDSIDSLENPFNKFRVGETLHARIIAKSDHSKKGMKGNSFELSLKPSLTAGDKEITPPKQDFNFPIGNIIMGFVIKIDTEWVWLAISRNITAHIYILDSSSEPKELENFRNQYKIGQPIKGKIISINEGKRLLRLKPESSNSNSTGCDNINENDIIGGKIKKILPGVGGILVQIGPHLHGRVNYTEIKDEWIDEPIEGFSEGQFVKTRVLNMGFSSLGTMHVDLSLRSSLLGSMEVCSNRFEKIDDVKPNMEVKGYVKNVTPKGCFIMLSRNIDARILISHLSDEYIENPEEAFPIGKLVLGRIVSVETSSKKVEVTLKKNMNNKESRKSSEIDFSNINVGDVINGEVRRVELYGLFITIENSKLVGLCHISQVSDELIDNLQQLYKTGDRVKAKILKVDEAKNRIALGMKQSHFNQNLDDKTTQISNKNSTENNNSIKAALMSDMIFDSIVQSKDTSIVKGKSKISVPTLEVHLDECEDSDNENNAVSDELVTEKDKDPASKKDIRLAKKKAKEQREIEISAAEEKSLKKEIPTSEEEFEKMVRNSPNSSYVWINYMAFMLDRVNVDKARAIAKRALSTINVREEDEKLNIWVALFNLENEHGNPPNEDVKKTFSKALEFCDQKKLHFALLGMYERTEQHESAAELLEKMTKKFRSSCKVWLRFIQNSLKQGKDTSPEIVKRALLSLPQKKHIKFISQSAILEFKIGVAERGKSMFEGILREYPKRTDLWSVYIDQEIRLGDSETIRALFERATCLSLPPKKMKFLFKKYLEFEKTKGDEERVEHVKRKALEFVNTPA